MSQEWPEALALQVLAYIIEESTLCGRFLDLTGVDPGDLVTRTADKEFLGAVVEFLLSDEPSLLQFCAEAGIDPHLPARAHMLLAGSAPEWS